MRIVILGTAHPYRGGLASFNERLANEFLIEGNEIAIETFKLQYPSILFPGKSQYSDSPKPENLKISRTVNSINPLNWLVVGLQLKKKAPDILILKFWLPFMAPCFGTIARIAKNNNKTKVIAILDNIIPHEKRIGDIFLSKYFTKSIDGFVAMSKNVLSDLKQFDTIKPAALTPHPLFDNFGKRQERNKALKTLNLEEKFRYILFFGFIRDYKGLDLLLQAFTNEWFVDKPIKILVAGEFYSSEDKYMKLIKECALTHRIELHTDFIPNEQVSSYFCAADIVAQPYKSATQSGVTQIGYHFNKPMLVTNVGGLAEIIPHGKVGYVVEPDKDSIAKALIDFFENDMSAFFEKNILEEKKKYTWDKMVETVKKIYTKIKEHDHSK